MLPPQKIPGLVPASKAGGDNFSPVHPDSHVRPRDQVAVAMMTESSSEFPFNPDTLPHGYLSGEFHAAAAPCRVLTVEKFRLPEKHRDALAGNSFCLGLCVFRGH